MTDSEGGQEGSTIGGTGLGLVGVALEQDAAYWEWHIALPARAHVDTILFGVTGKKDRKFYQELEGKSQEEDQEEGTTQSGCFKRSCPGCGAVSFRI